MTSHHRLSAKTASRLALQTFILEPILTPSGLIDNPDGPDILDLPDRIDVDLLDRVDVDDLDPETIDPDAPDLEGSDSDAGNGDLPDPSVANLPDADLPDTDLEPLDFITTETAALSPQFDSGVFTVGDSGEVSIDFLFDGGKYKGELAIFSLEGMDELEPGSDAFINEAVSRALSSSDLGHVVISDRTEGARFSGTLGEPGDWNQGDYLGVKTFQMNPGDEFGIMLAPNSSIQSGKSLLFSMATANPDDAFHLGQIADATGYGDTFIFEDMGVDLGSDLDYNDIIFRVRGATAEAVHIDDVINPTLDWRNSDLGYDLLAYADASIEFETPVSNQPLIGIIDTGFNANNPDVDYSRIILGSDLVDGNDNPLVQSGDFSEHGTHILGIIAATRDNGVGIDGINDDAPIWAGRAVGSGQWADSLVEFVDAAKESDRSNAVINLSFDLTQIDTEGNVTTRYELTPIERESLEYARQNDVLIVAAAGNDGGTMSALGQASQEFDNIITVGSADYEGDRAYYSSTGLGLDLVAFGGVLNEPVTSTWGDGSDLDLFAIEEEPPNDEMSVNAEAVINEVFGSFSDDQWENEDEELPGDLTDEEKLIYEEITQEIDGFLNDYLKDASNKIAIEFADNHYAASVDLLEKFLDAFDEDLADTLIKAEEIFGEDSDGIADGSEPNDLDFSIPLNLGVDSMAGTSVAAAKVTGAVSQVWAANPDLSFPQIKAILKQTAVDLNTDGWDAETGSGLVNIAAAVELAKRTQPEPYDPEPLLSPLTWSGEGKVTPAERAVGLFTVPTFTGRVMNAGYVTQTGWLRIRSGPGTNYSQVGLKYPGNAINFDGYDNNGRWVPDPFMPGGGSSRWYRIAGTNHWMSALYIDNTPERAEEERRRQEEIRRAEEEARRAEEEARRAEEEARRAEEELRRLEEEQQRRQEQLQTAVNQLAQKAVDLGQQIGSYISNGVTVYKFEKGVLQIQPDGRYSFSEVAEEVGEFFHPSNEIGPLFYLKDNYLEPDLETAANYADLLISGAENIGQLGQQLAYKGLISPLKNRLNTGFILPDSFSPRFGKYSQYVDESFSFLNKQLYRFDDFLAYKIAKNSGKNGFILPGLKQPRFFSRYAKLGTTYTKYAGTIGTVIGLVPAGYELIQADSGVERREILVEAALETSLSLAFGTFGGAFGGPAGAIVGGIAGAYLGSLAAEAINNHWEPLTQPIKDGWNTATSAFENALEAAKEKARAAKEKAEVAADKAKAAYRAAKVKVQEAKIAYQTFKEETKKQVTKIVQQSKKKLEVAAKQALQRAAQRAPRVVRHVANYARRAVKAVGRIINGAKQIAGKVIDTGRRIVNKVIDTGRQAYRTVKRAVTDVYNTGKKITRNVYNQGRKAVKSVKKSVSGGFKKAKSFFGL